MMTMQEPKTEPQSSQSQQHQQQQSSQLCAGCGKHIQDRFLLRALDLLWHEDCLKCGCCDCRLGEVGSTLYTKGNLMLCKRDYLRLFGNTGYCNACNKVIPAFEMVMRARNNVYHLECFACQQCNHRFCVGDKFYLCENKILCEYDYEERLVFASMANHPILKRHAGSMQQQPQQQGPQSGHNGQHHPPPNGLLMGSGGGGGGGPMMGRNGLNGGSPHVGDHNNNQNGPSNGNGTPNGGGSLGLTMGSSPFSSAHMKQALGTSS